MYKQLFKEKKKYYLMLIVSMMVGFTFFQGKSVLAEKLPIANQIPLDLKMVTAESGSRDVNTLKGLVDEQSKLYRDGSNLSGAIDLNKGWDRSSTRLKGTFYFDLESEYELDSLAYFDGNGPSDIVFSIGEPGSWKKISTRQDVYNIFVELDSEVKGQKTRYIRVECPSTSGVIREIAAFGKKTGNSGVEHSIDSKPIKLEKDMVTNIKGFYSSSPASSLVDEQPDPNKIGFPDYEPKTHFGLAYGAGHPKFSYEAVVNVNIKKYVFAHIRMYN